GDVVPSVLQFLQSADEARHDVTRADVSDDSAHPLESAPLKRLFVLFVLALAACGKRGDPHPPVPIIPKATTDLVVAQRGPKVLLSWSYPSMTTAGKTMTGIRRVVVWRATEELPVSQPPRDPSDVDAMHPTSIHLFAKIPTLAPAQFLKLRNRIDSIEGANLPAATTGARLTYEDTPPFHTTDGRPI